MATITIRELRATGCPVRDVIGFFALRKKELRVKDADGKPFLSLELGDATGRIDAVLWNDAAVADKQIQAGDVVELKGALGSYRDAPQIKVEKIRKAGPGEYDAGDFIATSPVSAADREAAIRAETVGVRQPHLAKLLGLFFDNSEMMRAFLAAPGAKLWHHPYLGGLSEHTAAVCRLARAAPGIYPLIDKDLLMAGCLLHDIGKVREYAVTTFIDYSDEGRLLGHIVLGDQMVAERIAQIKDFPEELSKRLRHMVLSHHGEKERGSPVTPATLEALALHHCDHLDSHAAAFTRIITREGGQNKRWSEYVNLIDRHIYLGGKDEGVKETGELTLL